MNHKAPRTYELNEKPPVPELIPLCLQHVLLFLASTLAIPLIIGSSLGFSSAEITLMLQCSIFIAGIGTILQSLGVGPVGNRLPIILGATFTFVTPAIAISQAYGFPAFIGASLVCGVAVALFGAVSVKFIRKVFPPVAMGCVIMVIGLTLVSVAVGYCAGGSDSPTYGSLQNYGVALFTLVIVIALNAWGKGFIKGASVLIALIAGFVLSAALGMVDFSSLNDSSWFSLAQPLHFGISFQLPAIIIMALLTLVNLVEFLGDTSTVAFITANRVATKEDLSRGVVCDGVASILGALFNSTPTISYSGNIGLIGVTGVKSRYVVAAAGGFMVVLGFIPKLAAFLSLIPTPVIGGATLVVFGSIAANGLKMLGQQQLSERDMLLIAVSLAIGLGFSATPAALADYPFYVSALINGIPGTAFSAILLNLILPKDKAVSAMSEENAQVESK